MPNHRGFFLGKDALHADSSLARYEVTKIGSQVNGLLKEIGKKKKVRAVHNSYSSWYYYAGCSTGRLTIVLLQNKEDATDLLEQKAELEKSKKAAEDFAVQKENQRDMKLRSIGNYVHESVPVSNDEVSISRSRACINVEDGRPACLIISF